MSATKTKIIEFIEKNGPAKAKSLALAVGISPQALHRHLKAMVEAGTLIKRGSAPVVFYEMQRADHTLTIYPDLPSKTEAFINENFYYVSPSGKRSEGLSGFQVWVDATSQANAYEALAKAYVKTRSELDRKFADGRVDATAKIRGTFETVHLAQVVYQDFWSIPQFGRTRLGHLVTLGKSGQNLESIKILARESKPILEDFIAKNQIEALAFAPHSIPRKLVFLKTFSELMQLKLPVVKFGKALTDGIAVAQKSLSKLDERIKNARETIFVMTPQVPYQKILIIDDALGSGATMNEMAGKLKEKNVSEVLGFAIVGSLKGFEVIPEV